MGKVIVAGVVEATWKATGPSVKLVAVAPVTMPPGSMVIKFPFDIILPVPKKSKLLALIGEAKVTVLALIKKFKSLVLLSNPSAATCPLRSKVCG